MSHIQTLELLFSKGHFLGVPSWLNIYSVHNCLGSVVGDPRGYLDFAAEAECTSRFIYPRWTLYSDGLRVRLSHVDVEFHILELKVSLLDCEQLPVVLLLGLREGGLLGLQLDGVVADLDEYDALHHLLESDVVHSFLL